MIYNHMFRQAITDMQDKYCGDRYDIYRIQSRYKGYHKRGGAAEGRATSFMVAAEGRQLCMSALNKVNIAAVTTILVLHVGDARSEHVWLDIMALARLSVRPIFICFLIIK